MRVIKIIDPTPTKVGDVTVLKAKEGNVSPPNREVELHGRDLTARTVTVKANTPHPAC